MHVDNIITSQIHGHTHIHIYNMHIHICETCIDVCMYMHANVYTIFIYVQFCIHIYIYEEKQRERYAASLQIAARAGAVAGCSQDPIPSFRFAALIQEPKNLGPLLLLSQTHSKEVDSTFRSPRG